MKTPKHTRASYLFEAEEREQTIASIALRESRTNKNNIIPNKTEGNANKKEHALDRLQELDESVQSNIIENHYVLNNAKNMSKNMSVNDKELTRLNDLINDEHIDKNSSSIIDGEVI